MTHCGRIIPYGETEVVCGERCAWVPFVFLRTSVEDEGIEIALTDSVCASCVREVEADELVDDRLWKQCEAYFLSKRGQLPNRKILTLNFKRAPASIAEAADQVKQRYP